MEKLEMTNQELLQVDIDILTPSGTDIQVRLCESRAILLVQTPQVHCQVIVDATQQNVPKALPGRRDV